MKSKSFIVCLLGVLIVAALDDVPDPPALQPHTVSVASIVSKVHRIVCGRRLNINWFRSSSHIQIPWITLKLAYEPNLPSDWMVLTGYAADPSPPGLEARRTLYL